MIGYEDYPFADAPPDLIDPWGCDTRECTSFCAWRISHDLGYRFQCLGNARDWPLRAVGLGVRVDTRPTFGSVIALPPGVGGAGEWGHVAFVMRVNGDGTVFVEDYNYALAPTFAPDAYNQHYLATRGAWFLHFEPAAAPPPPPCPPGYHFDTGRCEPFRPQVSLRGPWR